MTPKDECKKVTEELNKEEEARCSTSSDDSIIIGKTHSIINQSSSSSKMQDAQARCSTSPDDSITIFIQVIKVESEARCSTSSDDSIIIQDIQDESEEDTSEEEKDLSEEQANKEEETRCSTSSDDSIIIIQDSSQDENEEEARCSTSSDDSIIIQDISDESEEEQAEKENSGDCQPIPNNPVVKGPDDEAAKEEQNQQPTTLCNEFRRLAKQGWYWGPITRAEAEKEMKEQPNGSFLVRDSSDDRYLLSLSFRSNDRTLHTRFEYFNGTFSFYVNDQRQTFDSVVDLIDISMEQSFESGIFCYSRSREPSAETYPVKLMHPVSRLTQVCSLEYLCRFAKRQLERVDHLEQLPLPHPIKGFVNKKYF